MGLIGSLEDLGLGELLQIINLSRKSGTLSLHSECGEGFVLLHHGEVRGAGAKGAVSDLRSLLVGLGVVEADVFDRAFEIARDQGLGMDVVLVEGGAVDRALLDGVKRGHIQGCVLGMCSWDRGDFRFEREDPSHDDPALRILPGISAEFIVMEAARLSDERAFDTPGALPDEAPQRALFAARRAALGDGERAVATPPPPLRRPILAVDPDPAILGWLDRALSEGPDPIHLFQRLDAAVARLRQYLARGVVPVLLLDPDAGPDPVTGSPDAPALVRRLKELSPGLRVLWLERRGPRARLGRSASPADGQIEKPGAGLLADPQRQAEAAAMGAALAAAIGSDRPLG